MGKGFHKSLYRVSQKKKKKIKEPLKKPTLNKYVGLT